MYKRFIFITFIIILFCNNIIFAQKRASLGLSYDIGASTYFFVSDININNDVISNSIIRTNGLGFVFTYTDDLMGVQIGAKRIPKGWVENFKNGASRTFKIDFLEVPIMTHMRFSRKRKSGLILNYGLFLAKALNHTITADSIPDYTVDTSYIDYENPVLRKFDYGIKGGIGYEIELGKHNLQLQIMYAQGMRDLFEPDRVRLYRSLSQSLTASVIYKFSFYRKTEDNSRWEAPNLRLQEKQKRKAAKKAEKATRKANKKQKKEAIKNEKADKKDKADKKTKTDKKVKVKKEKTKKTKKKGKKSKN